MNPARGPCQKAATPKPSTTNSPKAFAVRGFTNTASQKVAVRNGMKIIDKDTKNFRYIDMDFFLYSAERTNEAQIPQRRKS